MNKIEQPHRFSTDAVRKHPDDKHGAAKHLNATARNIASQFRRDTMSPIMVSGVLRLVELALLALAGTLLFVHYVGLGTSLTWQYPIVIACGSLIAVILLDIVDCYQLSALMRPVSQIGRIAAVWAGTLALFAVIVVPLSLLELKEQHVIQVRAPPELSQQFPTPRPLCLAFALVRPIRCACSLAGLSS